MGETLELERGASREDREHDADRWPAVSAGAEPREVGGLHLSGVAGGPCPPARLGLGGRAPALRVYEDEAVLLGGRVEEPRHAIELEQGRGADSDTSEASSTA